MPRRQHRARRPAGGRAAVRRATGRGHALERGRPAGPRGRTLGAFPPGAIVDADLGRPAAIAAYLVFVVGAVSIHLAAIGITVLAPARAGAMLERASALLERYSRAIMITLGLVFGTWFLAKALGGFGIL